MPARNLPTPQDAATARRILLGGLARDSKVSELVGELAPLHSRNNTFPGEVFLRVAADWEIEGEVTEDYREVKLSRLHPGEQFAYVFDLGDDWAHLCTVGPRRIDPAEVLGIRPDTPLPYWGWGDIPDQYRRRWDGDDGESPPPRNPELADLPPLRPHWGPSSRRPRRRFTAL